MAFIIPGLDKRGGYEFGSKTDDLESENLNSEPHNIVL